MEPPELISLPEQTGVRFWSPGFHAKPPILVGRDRLDANAHNAMRGSWDKSFYEERPAVLTELSNVYVVAEGLIFYSRGRLYTDSITQHNTDEIALAYQAIRKCIESKPSPHPGMFALALKRGAKNYGHWLAEMLPMAYYSNYLSPSSIDYFIVPDAYGGMKSVIEQSMSLIGVKPERLFPHSGKPLLTSKLTVINGLTAHGVYMSPLVIDILRVLASQVKGRGHEKILVSRKSASGRRLIDEQRFEDLAKAKGYVVLDPGSMTLHDQISAFKSAKSILGVAGAGMTNMAFSSSGAKAFLLYPDNMPDTFFWFIGIHNQLQFHDIRCTCEGPPIRGMPPWNRSIAVPTEVIDMI